MTRPRVTLLVLASVALSLILALAGILGIGLLLNFRGNGAVCGVLLFEVDPESIGDRRDVDLDRVVGELDRRINTAWRPGAIVRRHGSDGIEVIVYGDDPQALRRVERLATRTGTLEFRVLANNVDHADLLARAQLPENADATHLPDQDDPYAVIDACDAADPETGRLIKAMSNEELDTIIEGATEAETLAILDGVRRRVCRGAATNDE